MQLTRSSRTRTVLVALALAALVAGTAMAATVESSDVPEESQVGDPIQASATITDLYENGNSEWTLVTETELGNTSWTIEYLNQTGAVVETQEVSDQQVVNGRTVSPPIDEIRIQVRGDTPAVENYEYGTNQTFVGLRVAMNVQGTDETIRAWNVDHYTDASRAAKQALDAAQGAITEAENSGADVSQAREEFEEAQTLYSNEQFGLAEETAGEAESLASDAAESSSGGLPVLPLVGGGLVVLILVGVGVYYYRQQDQQQSKLR